MIKILRARPLLSRSLLSQQSCFVDATIRFFSDPFVSGTSPRCGTLLSSLFRYTSRHVRDKNVANSHRCRAVSAILRFYRITINTIRRWTSWHQPAALMTSKCTQRYRRARLRQFSRGCVFAPWQNKQEIACTVIPRYFNQKVLKPGLP